MPRVWNETIDAHRRAVRDATLDATAELAADRGLRAVTMSQIAERTGIGRATLYKYYSDVDAILLAWHERQITAHLEQLAHARDRVGNPRRRLEAVLVAYALIAHDSLGHHDAELAALLHRDGQVDRGEQQLRDMITGLLIEAGEAGLIRVDIRAEELGRYCLHALTAARGLPSKAAVHRLVTVILAGLSA